MSLDMFRAWIKPYSEKLENMLKIGSSTNVKGADGELQEVQLKTLRNIEDAKKVGQFGFNSKQPSGSRNIVAKIGNEKIVIACEHIESIIDVDEGDSVLYNKLGKFIKIAGEDIIINAGSGDTIFKADGTVEFASGAKLDNTGDYISSTNISLSKHTHIGNMGAPTGPPLP